MTKVQSTQDYTTDTTQQQLLDINAIQRLKTCAKDKLRSF